MSSLAVLEMESHFEVLDIRTSVYQSLGGTVWNDVTAFFSDFYCHVYNLTALCLKKGIIKYLEKCQEHIDVCYYPGSIKSRIIIDDEK